MLLQPKHSFGHDHISTYLLKRLNLQLCHPISHLINKSLESGIVPDSLKIAKVIPIYKSKEKNELKNYRPISLLPAISKLYEKIVYKRLYDYMQDKLYTRQYGFRQKHSTIDAITEFYTDTLKAFENKINT